MAFNSFIRSESIVFKSSNLMLYFNIVVFDFIIIFGLVFNLSCSFKILSVSVKFHFSSESKIHQLFTIIPPPLNLVHGIISRLT